uniref:Uncharacterized protein n=1 Tax=Physcomitrium patens TaxID=3218 RepID=A0A2K1JIZ6_PHYPA|nr:hypothetical protein PHYPA_018924 [Physcomitrium patens]
MEVGTGVKVLLVELWTLELQPSSTCWVTPHSCCELGLIIYTPLMFFDLVRISKVD